MRFQPVWLRTAVCAAALSLAGTVAAAAPASATARSSHQTRSCIAGQTAVTTAPGIATTLVSHGVVPLPVIPHTGFGLSFSQGSLQAVYRFPITGGNPNLSGPSGDINHAGGIYFVSWRGHLEVGKFDIDLSAGKIFATQVNYRAARLPVLDLDLSKLAVKTQGNTTVLSGIGLKLDPVAAGALNSTFQIGLPTDGSLLFGTGQVTIKSKACNTWPH